MLMKLQMGLSFSDYLFTNLQLLFETVFLGFLKTINYTVIIYHHPQLIFTNCSVLWNICLIIGQFKALLRDALHAMTRTQTNLSSD